MEQFLYILRVNRLGMLTGGSTDAEAQILGRHASFVSGLAAEGTVLVAGRTLNSDEKTIGLVVLQAQSRAKAIEIMENDPAVSQGVMNAELFPYKVAFWGSSIAKIAGSGP